MITAGSQIASQANANKNKNVFGDIIYNVKAYGAKGDGINDDTAAIQKTIDVASEVVTDLRGGIVFFPKGTYICTNTLNLRPYITLKGAGKLSSLILCNHTGDGVKSVSTINGSTRVNINVSDIAIQTDNPSNLGGGFVDIAGTYIQLDNIFIRGFRAQVIFDQTEVSSIQNSEFIHGSGCVGIWLVNGPDNTPGANLGFTNSISIINNQFNGTNSNRETILDDGGANHYIVGNNFNGSKRAIRACGVSGLTFEGNASEVHTNDSIYLTDHTAISNTYVGGVLGFSIEENTFADIVPIHIVIDTAISGSIRNNVTTQFTTSFIGFNNPSPAAQISIDNNAKGIRGNSRTAAPFVNINTETLGSINNSQRPQSYVPLSGNIGIATVTPATMEGISVGDSLVAINEDGTNYEIITVSSRTGGSFNTTLAQTKSANWLIYGRNDSIKSGVFTPTIAGSTTPGSHTYSVQKGSYYKIGNMMNVSITIAISSKDAAMAGSIVVKGLPFVSRNSPSDSDSYVYCLFSGFTLPTSFTEVGGSFAAGSTDITLLRSGSGVSINPIQSTDIPGTTLTLTVQGTYFV